MNSNEMNYLESEDYVFKFVIIGDSGVGKSCIMHHFIFNKCKKNLKWLYINSQKGYNSNYWSRIFF